MNKNASLWEAIVCTFAFRDSLLRKWDFVKPTRTSLAFFSLKMLNFINLLPLLWDCPLYASAAASGLHRRFSILRSLQLSPLLTYDRSPRYFDSASRIFQMAKEYVKKGLSYPRSSSMVKGWCFREKTGGFWSAIRGFVLQNLASSLFQLLGYSE
jgi:hypothetical protein